MALRVEEPSAKYLVADESALVRGFGLMATGFGGVPRLRDLIRSLAVRGLLVPQHPADGSATDLVVEIRAFKDRLVADGKLRPDKVAEQVGGADRLFAIPSSWVWVRFGNASINRDGERVPISSEDRQQRAKVFDYYGASGVIDKIDGYLFDKTLLLIGEDGANLINRATPVAFLASGKYWVNNHAHVVDTPHHGLMKYLCLFINAISLEAYITGTAQPKMNQAKLNSIPIALPPLAEQYRIVARVEELMKLCDALEQSGRLADEQHAQLTSTLFDALAASESAHDLHFFKNITWGMPVIMGRKTFEAVNKPLPGRFNIVITRQQDWNAEGVIVTRDLSNAIKKAAETNCKENFIIGGGEIYKQGIQIADKIYLTRVHASLDGDTFFPVIEEAKWLLTSNQDFTADEKHAFAYSFQTWKRK